MMPKGKKGFQSGDYWNGNSGGAKKKEFRRDAFTDEIFAERKADVREVVQIWFTYAKSGQKWAIERVLDIFLTKPKNSDEITSSEYSSIFGIFSQMPEEKL